jgi:hypothetical protein
MLIVPIGDLLNMFAGEFRDRVKNWPTRVGRVATLAREVLTAAEVEP